MTAVAKPKRKVSSVSQTCARAPTKPSKFEKPAGIVTVEQQTKFFHLVANGCPNCRSPYVDVQVSQFGACLKAKLLCGKNHSASWDSSAGMVLFHTHVRF